MQRCLAKKYKDPKNEEFKKLGEIYRYKFARYIYQINHYFSITIFGYILLHILLYFPKSMLGKGYISTMFAKPVPNSYF